jgi:co-chaperonin GroES (HSP10)
MVVIKGKIKELQFTPSPGIAIIEEIKETETQGGIVGVTEKHRIIPGKIIAIGKDLVTDAGAILKANVYGRVGDIVYFIHYYEEGGYDVAIVNQTKYYTTKFQDFRFNVK